MFHQRNLARPLAIAVLAALAGTASPVQAQTPIPAPSEESVTIPDEKIDAVASAVEQVSTLKQNYEQRLLEAAPDDQERIVGEANAEMERVVTEKGLSVDEYNAIITIAQSDSGVRQRILDRVR